jgi:hypothetical protein
VDEYFQTETVCTYEEYKKFNWCVHSRFKFTIAFMSLTGLMFVMSFFSSLFFSKRLAAAFFVFVVLYYGAVVGLIININGKKTYNSNPLIHEARTTFYFYHDHFEYFNSYGHTSLLYTNIYEIYETKTNFYIMLSKNQGLIIIKNNCQPEHIAFIQNVKKQLNK